MEGARGGGGGGHVNAAACACARVSLCATVRQCVCVGVDVKYSAYFFWKRHRHVVGYVTFVYLFFSDILTMM